jgi:hypothetical protein
MPTTRTCFVILLVRQDHGYIEWGAVTNCRPDASYEDGDVVFFLLLCIFGFRWLYGHSYSGYKLEICLVRYKRNELTHTQACHIRRVCTHDVTRPLCIRLSLSQFCYLTF